MLKDATTHHCAASWSVKIYASQPADEKYTYFENRCLIKLLCTIWAGGFHCVKWSNNEVMYLDQIIVLVHCVHMEHHLFSAVCVSSVCVRGREVSTNICRPQSVWLWTVYIGDNCRYLAATSSDVSLETTEVRKKLRPVYIHSIHSVPAARYHDCYR